MSGASFQDCVANKEPLSLFRKMHPGERNAWNTLCNTTTSSGISAAGSHEMSDRQAKHSGDTGVLVENYPDYMEISAADTTDGRSTSTSADTAKYKERHRELESVEEEEEGSDADEDGGEERGKSDDGSIVSDDSTSCDLEDEDLRKENGNTNELVHISITFLHCVPYLGYNLSSTICCLYSSGSHTGKNLQNHFKPVCC